MKFCKNILAVSIASTAIFGGCSSDSQIAGNSAETGSPELAGIFLLDNGKPAAFARVHCVPSDFDAASGELPAAYTTDTDSTGYYSLDSIPAGTYAVETFHEESGKRFLVQNVSITEDDSIAVSDTLRAPGSVEIAFNSLIEDGTSAMVTIPGTTILRKVIVHAQKAIIDSLPTDTLGLRIYIENDTLDYGDVFVKSDTTVQTLVNYPLIEYTFVAPLALPEGEDTLSSFVSDIPLALRLTAENSDIDTLARLQGRWEVVRISKDGKRSKKLPIVNSVLDEKEAIFWVSVDSLNVSDSLELSFNNALEPGYAHDVFPTNRSYSLVYHFDSETDIKDDAEKGYFDGSLTAAETGTETVANLNADGVLGTSITLDATTSIIATNSAKIDSTRKVNLSFDGKQFCFSLWVNLESLKQQTIFEKNDEYALRYSPEQGFVVEFYHIATENAADEGATDTASYKQTWASGTKGIEAGKWIFIAFSKHSIPQTNYFINSAPIEAEETRSDWDGNREFADFKIGGFNGKIDELMLGSAFRDDSWTRLTYLNQKPEDSWPKLSARK
ncbi:LamG-like jellyroll fold domain-containing protein [Fibrobacter sp. UWB13]|uniref:LamG-like jellyroll fold domain-containing protein n=1 Tax=Fibrobacter sp. UWB13 TaxID=1896204 RepID=UPI000A0A286F|nr:LamG-like jellyroll fold domain-containing protein [Fibrobacter sp. UWB13]SMG23125.1 Concanavalin A-like lectin/glucanases superfamily protein [Fibrobacter sp. UWB13]